MHHQKKPYSKKLWAPQDFCLLISNANAILKLATKCSLLIAFANSLDPDQDRQFDQDSENHPETKGFLKKSQGMKNNPECK